MESYDFEMLKGDATMGATERWCSPVTATCGRGLWRTSRISTFGAVAFESSISRVRSSCSSASSRRAAPPGGPLAHHPPGLASSSFFDSATWVCDVR